MLTTERPSGRGRKGPLHGRIRLAYKRYAGPHQNSCASDMQVDFGEHPVEYRYPCGPVSWYAKRLHRFAGRRPNRHLEDLLERGIRPLFAVPPANLPREVPCGHRASHEERVKPPLHHRPHQRFCLCGRFRRREAVYCHVEHRGPCRLEHVDDLPVPGVGPHENDRPSSDLSGERLGDADARVLLWHDVRPVPRPLEQALRSAWSGAGDICPVEHVS